MALLDGVAESSTDSGALDRVENRKSYRLSPSQERNLFLAQAGPGLATAYTIKGSLDYQRLQTVLNHIVARHASLRTVLPNKGDGLTAQVSSPVGAELAFHDFSEEDPDIGGARLRERLLESAAQEFILDQGPLYRFKLFRVNSDEHVLFIAFSQIVFDGTSFDLFLKELTEGYSALTQGRPWPFPPLQIEYMDYVEWKYRLLAERGPAIADWWKSTLGATVPYSPIPLDHPRQLVPDHKGGRIPLSIPADFADSIRELAKKHGVTTQVVLLGASLILINRLSGRPDCWIATPIDGRRFSSFEPIIGTFTNLILLRADLDQGTSFPIFLRSLRDYCMAAFDYQDFPIEQLGLRISKNGGRGPSPLFQMEFSYQQVSQRSTMMGPLSLSQVETHGGGTANELTLWVKDWGHIINGAFEYSTALFDGGTIAHWLNCFLGILRFVVEHPEAPLETIDPLAEEGTRIKAIMKGALVSLANHRIDLADHEAQSLRLFDGAGRPVPLGVWANLVSDARVLVAGIRLKTDGTWEIVEESLSSRGSRVDGAGRVNVPPHNPMQASILEIWKKVLNQDGFGITESFFDLGGHSLLATKLIREMNGSLGMHWTFRDLFETPTIEGLTAAQRADGSRSSMPLLFVAEKQGRGIPLFLIPGVYENKYNDDEGQSSYEQDFLRYFNNILLIMGKRRPIYGLRPSGIYKGEKFRTTISMMAKEYVEEIKSVQPQGPYLVGGECLGGAVAHAVACRLVDGGDAVSTLLLLDTNRYYFGYEILEGFSSFRHGIKAAVLSMRESFLQPNFFFAAMGKLLVRGFPVTRSLRERRRLELGPKKYASMLRHYRPRRYEGKTLLVVNEAWNAKRPLLGWDTAICPRLEVHVVPGDHTTRLNLKSDILERCMRENLG